MKIDVFVCGMTIFWYDPDDCGRCDGAKLERGLIKKYKENHTFTHNIEREQNKKQKKNAHIHFENIILFDERRVDFHFYTHAHTHAHTLPQTDDTWLHKYNR